MIYVNFVELIDEHVEKNPDHVAYTFLMEKTLTEKKITYRELALSSRSVGAMLQAKISPGDRVLLLYPPGLEFYYSISGLSLCRSSSDSLLHALFC